MARPVCRFVKALEGESHDAAAERRAAIKVAKADVGLVELFDRYDKDNNSVITKTNMQAVATELLPCNSPAGPVVLSAALRRSWLCSQLCFSGCSEVTSGTSRCGRRCATTTARTQPSVLTCWHSSLSRPARPNTC